MLTVTPRLRLSQQKQSYGWCHSWWNRHRPMWTWKQGDRMKQGEDEHSSLESLSKEREGKPELCVNANMYLVQNSVVVPCIMSPVKSPLGVHYWITLGEERTIYHSLISLFTTLLVWNLLTWHKQNSNQLHQECALLLIRWLYLLHRSSQFKN